MLSIYRKRQMGALALAVLMLLFAAVGVAEEVHVSDLATWRALVAKAKQPIGVGFANGNVNIIVDASITGIDETLVFGGAGWNIEIEGNNNTLEGDGSVQLIRVGDDPYSTANNTVTVENLTMTGGKAAGSTGAPERGGALFVQGSAELTNCTFSGNYATADGGAVYVTGNADIIGSTFEGNEAGFDGGGVFTAWGGATITGSTFERNVAGNNGGGVNIAENTTITDSTFEENKAKHNGGGVFVWKGDTTITNSDFLHNTADSDKNGTGLGGALYSDGGASVSANVVVTDSLFEGNTAVMGGAICTNNFTGSDTLTVSDSEFYDNTATDPNSGGAIHTFTETTLTGTNYFEGNTPDGNEGHGILTVNEPLTQSSLDTIVVGHKPPPPSGGTVRGTGAQGSSGEPRRIDYQRASIRLRGASAPVFEKSSKDAAVIGEVQNGEPVQLVQWAAGDTFCKVIYAGGNRAGWVPGEYIQP